MLALRAMCVVLTCQLSRVKRWAQTTWAVPGASWSRLWFTTMAAEKKWGVTWDFPSWPSTWSITAVLWALWGDSAMLCKVSYMILSFHSSSKQHVLYCLLALWGDSARNVPCSQPSQQNSIHLDATIKSSLTVPVRTPLSLSLEFWNRYLPSLKLTMIEWLCCAVLSHSVVSDSLWPHGLESTRLLCPWDSSGKNPGVGCHFLLRGISWTQGSNPNSCIGRQILYWWATGEALEKV